MESRNTEIVQSGAAEVTVASDSVNKTNRYTRKAAMALIAAANFLGCTLDRDGDALFKPNDCTDPYACNDNDSGTGGNGGGFVPPEDAGSEADATWPDGAAGAAGSAGNGGVGGSGGLDAGVDADADAAAGSAGMGGLDGGNDAEAGVGGSSGVGGAAGGGGADAGPSCLSSYDPNNTIAGNVTLNLNPDACNRALVTDWNGSAYITNNSDNRDLCHSGTTEVQNVKNGDYVLVFTKLWQYGVGIPKTITIEDTDKVFTSLEIGCWDWTVYPPSANISFTPYQTLNYGDVKKAFEDTNWVAGYCIDNAPSMTLYSDGIVCPEPKIAGFKLGINNN